MREEYIKPSLTILNFFAGTSFLSVSIVKTYMQVDEYETEEETDL